MTYLVRFIATKVCLWKRSSAGVPVGAFLDESFTSKIRRHYGPSNTRFFRLFAVFPNLLVRIWLFTSPCLSSDLLLWSLKCSHTLSLIIKHVLVVSFCYSGSAELNRRQGFHWTYDVLKYALWNNCVGAIFFMRLINKLQPLNKGTFVDDLFQTEDTSHTAK